jgi:ribosomal protein S18 acetylase RimI-like enzyme
MVFRLRPISRSRGARNPDLNVLPAFRRQGIATRLLDTAEQLVVQRASAVGIGVGMDSDYGAAQRLYVRRGYVPDGSGLTYGCVHVKYGDQIRVDDSLVLYLVKQLET